MAALQESWCVCEAPPPSLTHQLTSTPIDSKHCASLVCYLVWCEQPGVAQERLYGLDFLQSQVALVGEVRSAIDLAVGLSAVDGNGGVPFFHLSPVPFSDLHGVPH